MSTKIMSACWPLQIDPTAKAVLISLADNANDDGFCYPSIDYICERTCLSKRAVIEAIKRLENLSLVVANRSKRNTTYTISTDADVLNRCARCTGAPDAQVHLAPSIGASGSRKVHLAPKKVQQVHPNRQEPSRTVKGTVNINPDPKFDAEKYLLEQGVIKDVATDWLQHRKNKKALPTKTAIDGIVKEAMKAGMSLDEVLTECCQRGWIGFKAEWILKANIRSHSSSNKQEALERRNADTVERWLAKDQGNVIEGESHAA